MVVPDCDLDVASSGLGAYIGNDCNTNAAPNPALPLQYPVCSPASGGYSGVGQVTYTCKFTPSGATTAWVVSSAVILAIGACIASRRRAGFCAEIYTYTCRHCKLPWQRAAFNPTQAGRDILARGLFPITALLHCGITLVPSSILSTLYSPVAFPTTLPAS